MTTTLIQNRKPYTLDVTGLSSAELAAYDDFLSHTCSDTDPFSFSNETAVIRTQVSSSFDPFSGYPKLEDGIIFNLVPLFLVSHSQRKDMTTKISPENIQTLNDALRLGFCKARNGTLYPITSDYHLGITDEEKLLDESEIAKVIESIDAGNRAFHLACLLLFLGGPRESQELHIHVSDIDFSKKRVRVSPAKEGDPFYIDLSNWEDVLAEAAEYIKLYGLRQNDYLFCVRYKNGNWNDYYKSNEPIDRRTFYRWFEIYATKAGVNWHYVDAYGYRRNRVHPHTAKDTSCSMDYQVCKDSVAVARMHGNKDTSCVEKFYIKFRQDYLQKIRTNALKGLRGELYQNVEVKTLGRHNNEITRFEETES